MIIVGDIGGTSLRIASSQNGTTLECTKRIATPQAYEAGCAAVGRVAQSLCGADAITAAVIGVPGQLHRDRASLARAPHLKAWEGKPLQRDLHAALGATVRLENDTALVGLGESTEGAGRGARIIAYVGVGTGVGGVRVVGGQIDERAFGFEPGHQIVDSNGPMCEPCGQRGHLEALVSGSAVAARFGIPAHAVTDPAVWEDQARWLAIGLHNVALHWSPDRIVLGGSLMTSGAIAFDRVVEYFSELLTMFPEPPDLRLAELGDAGGLLGALALLRA